MSRYDNLMKEYLAELREAREKALKWWDALVARETALTGDRTQALQALKMRWMVGPVSHPYVIAVYRKYFLKIIGINESLDEEIITDEIEPETEAAWGVEEDEEDEEEGTIEPEYLLRHDLNCYDEELYEFMQPLVFSTIGLDSDENYV